MGKMDQNSEVLNRVIRESLKQVDRGRRRRGAVILGLGILVSLLAYGLPFISQWEGHVPGSFFRIIAYPGMACIVYGTILMSLGAKARLLYFKYFGASQSGRAIFYAILITIAALLDLFFSTAIRSTTGH
jgi:hypothetical protein